MCLQQHCFRLSDHINSPDSDTPHKSFKTHTSHGTTKMPSSPGAMLSGNNRTRTHTPKHKIIVRETQYEVSNIWCSLFVPRHLALLWAKWHIVNLFVYLKAQFCISGPHIFTRCDCHSVCVWECVRDREHDGACHWLTCLISVAVNHTYTHLHGVFARKVCEWQKEQGLSGIFCKCNQQLLDWEILLFMVDIE